MNAKMNKQLKASEQPFELTLKKMREVCGGYVVTADESILDRFGKKGSAGLESMAIPNPNSVGVSDTHLVGLICTDVIERYRLDNGMITKAEVDMISKIETASGQHRQYAYVYAHNACIGKEQSERMEALQEILSEWELKRSVTRMTSDIESLNLKTQKGLLRAIQITMIETRVKASIKDAIINPINNESEQQAKIFEIEKYGLSDMKNPLCVLSLEVVEAILNKDSRKLIQCFCFGIFTASEKVFSLATGVKIARLSKANKRIAIEKWGAGELTT
jgi:hypothetical protein